MLSFFAKLFARPRPFYILPGLFALSLMLETISTVSGKFHYLCSDYSVYSCGRKIILDGRGKDLYDMRTQLTYCTKGQQGSPGNLSCSNVFMLPYRAPPITALLSFPHTNLKENWNALAATAVGFLIVVLATAVIAKTTQETGLAILAIFSSPFIWSSIIQAQPLSWIILITTLLYRSLLKKDYSKTGLLAALCIIKPQFLTIAPIIYLLTGRSAAFSRTFAISLSVLILLNIYISGTHTFFVAYPKFLLLTNGADYGGPSSGMYSIQQLVYRLSSLVTDSKIPSLAIGAMFYVWGLFKIRKLLEDGQSGFELFPIGITIAVLSSYHVLPQDMSLFSVALAIWIIRFFNTQKGLGILLVTTIQILGGILNGGRSNYYCLLIIFLLWLAVTRLVPKKSSLRDNPSQHSLPKYYS